MEKRGHLKVEELGDLEGLSGEGRNLPERERDCLGDRGVLGERGAPRFEYPFLHPPRTQLEDAEHR